MKHKRKKFLSLLLMLSAVVGLLTCLVEDAHASVKYMEASYNDTTGVTYTEREASNATEVTNSDTAVTWGTANATTWYYVNNDVTISERITVKGTVNLILGDGKTLTASWGINVADGNTLNIYAQTNGTGTLNAEIGEVAYEDDYGEVIQARLENGRTAAIGGNENEKGGTITIHGGTVKAKSGYKESRVDLGGGAGIGGGRGGEGGTLTIYSGDITATGGYNHSADVESIYAGAGIGGGSQAAGGTVKIYGGTVTAIGNPNGYANGAGIGGGGYMGQDGSGGAGGTISIYGGTVTATGGKKAAGIGDAKIASSSTVSIYGGTVNATGGEGGAGIGNGYERDHSNPNSSSTININGGTVTATGGNDAAGIGSGNHGGPVTISITGGIVSADSGGGTGGGAGIGSGNSGGSVTISITGGTVSAAGSVYQWYGGAGIGSGSGGSGGTVTISGGNVTANGGYNDAQGIGKGSSSVTFESITLTVIGDLIVYGDSNPNPTKVIPSPYDSRPQYMKVGPAIVPYVEMNFDAATSQVTSEEKTVLRASCVFVSPDITTWSNDAWYVVSGSVQVSSRITVSGDIHLILRDGAVLSADSGITVADGHTLNIYAQTGGTGSLVATGSANTAGIGSGGALTIHGGNISVTGGNGAAAIYCTSVDVYNGYVEANGGSSTSAGIDGTLTLSSIIRVFGGSSTSEIGILTDYSSNRPQYMRAATPHASHTLRDYQLSTDGMTITAVCENDDQLCVLPNATATLTITAPIAAGGAATLSGDADAFGVSTDQITYAKKNGSDWEELDNPPTTQGFFRASITVGTLSASVRYGVSAITVNASTNGTITAPAVATVGVVVPLTISPATGYELDTLTPTKTSGGEAISVTTASDGSKSFIMPDEEVTVSATFKMKDYTIYFDVTNITSGSIIVPETAHYQDIVRVVISPDAGYGVYSFDVEGMSDFALASKDTDTGVEVYTFTMPAGNVSLDVTFAATTIYTIFYKTTDSPTSIAYRFSSADISFDMRANAKAGDTECWGGQMRGAVGRASFPISFNTDGGGWGAFVNCEVVTDMSNFNTIFSGLANNTAVLVAGDENALIASFKWGYYDTDPNTGEPVLRDDFGVKNYFVTASTNNVSVPNPTRTGYTFAGWSYIDKDGAAKSVDVTGSSTITVAISGNIDKTTVFGAIWHINTSTVSYDLNGGSWSNTNTATVDYGNTLTLPTDPTRDNYAFNGWRVKSKARAMKGTQEITLAAGSNFDSASTKIIDNITLQAAWKHTHAYVRIPLSSINSVIPNCLTQEEIESYSPYMHFVMCSLADDYYFEAHTYDKNGKCVCGAVKPSSTVTLEKTYGDRTAGLIVKSTPAKDSEVTLVAPPKGTDQFVKWEYRSLNGSTWYDLAAAPVVGFVIPGSLRVNAVYEKLTAPQLTLQAEHYGDDGLVFTMQYMLPDGWKATNAAVIYGDNHMLRYMEVVRYSTPVFSLQPADPFIGIPLSNETLDIGTSDEGTYYNDREDNMLSVAGNKSVLRNKMLKGEAVNIPGYNDASSRKAQSLGQTSGYAYNGLTGVKDENNGDHYFYGLGFVEYTDANNTEHMAVVGPIAVTYNTTSTPVTSTDIYIYNY